MSIQQVLQYFPPGYVREDIAAAHAAGDLGRLWGYFALYRGQAKPAVCGDISAALQSAIQMLIRERGHAGVRKRAPGTATCDLASLWREARISRDQPDERDDGMIFEIIRILAAEQGDAFFQNRALNEIEIREGKTVLASRPRLLQVVLTSRCNIRCRFCGQGAADKRLWDLSDRVCDEVIGYLPYLQRVEWMGGEAFLHPRFREMVRESAKYPHLEQTVITNGLFLDDSWVALFARASSASFSLPMESLNAELYGRLRQGGSLPRLQKNIEELAAARRSGADIRMLLNLIVMKSNYREVEAIAGYAVDHGFSHLVLTPLYSPGVPEDFFAQEYASPDDPEIRQSVSAAVGRIRERTRGTAFTIDERFLRSGCGDGSGPAAEQAPGHGECGAEHRGHPAMRSPVCACRAPWQQMEIDIGGWVRPFCFCEDPVGNTDKAGLEEIWNGPKMRALRTSILKGEVGGCSSKCSSGQMNLHDIVLD